MLYGEKGNLESIQATDEYYQILNEVVLHDDKLRERLLSLPELSALYRKASENIDKLSRESEVTHYAEGFKLGILVGLELTQK